MSAFSSAALAPAYSSSSEANPGVSSISKMRFIAAGESLDVLLTCLFSPGTSSNATRSMPAESIVIW